MASPSGGRSRPSTSGVRARPAVVGTRPKPAVKKPMPPKSQGPANASLRFRHNRPTPTRGFDDKIVPTDGRKARGRRILGEARARGK